MPDYNLGPFRIRPRGEFVSSEHYRFLDLVSYNGGSYLCCNMDTIDGIAVTGVLPEGETKSELYWQCIAHKGEKGDMGGSYNEFIEITDGMWDFDKSDKIVIPESGSNNIQIFNVYNGCCGIILTNKDLSLPVNSDYSIDFYYTTCGTNQYYMYTFVYGSFNLSSERFIWNRTVIDR